MFGRKKPQLEATPAETESDRTTSYRISQDAAPPTTGINKTTSYVNAMQHDGRGYETIN
ncbi:MAG: hypothetical protein ACRDRO_10720 [Pseudonocardiaceae bacterium]